MRHRGYACDAHAAADSLPHPCDRLAAVHRFGHGAGRRLHPQEPSATKEGAHHDRLDVAELDHERHDPDSGHHRRVHYQPDALLRGSGVPEGHHATRGLRDEACECPYSSLHLLGLLREHPRVYRALLRPALLGCVPREPGDAEGDRGGAGCALCRGADPRLLHRDPRPSWVGHRHLGLGGFAPWPRRHDRALRGVQGRHPVSGEAVPGEAPEGAGG
mmetsp:Transcript_98886/g.221554  ORF Transcript_98886/g.221554 Transcript_98886/m.221554 type:complete len:217 (-) Transcript_98886:333-983(-)